jgi:SAM-dependent methyltransferase
VLDAGCGKWRPEIGLDRCCHVVGIDVSPRALELNCMIDEKIVGDVQTYPLPRESFDVIVCWDVLEHLPRPRRALDNFTRALKPGGRMILGLPNIISPKAVVTKFTPLSFHVWFKRSVLKQPQAGLPGFGPFKTYLRWSLRPGALRRYAIQNGLDIDVFERYEPEDWRWLWNKYQRLGALVAVAWPRVCGGANPRESELRVVLVKQEPDTPGRRGPEC